ncbi:MAG: hypothetical protein R3B70_45075 [Polyangiaceae bacterium]
MSRARKRSLLFLLCSGLLAVVPRCVEAFELSGGVGAGGALAGSRPRFAVSPRLGILWHGEGGFLFSLQETMSILPAVNEHGPGVYNQISAALGYAWRDIRLSVGPAISTYSMPACGILLCARIRGLSPAIRVQVDFYFAGPLGVSVGGSVDWLTGSEVLPDGVLVSAMAGPVIKWGDR